MSVFEAFAEKWPSMFVTRDEVEIFTEGMYKAAYLNTFGRIFLCRKEQKIWMRKHPPVGLKLNAKLDSLQQIKKPGQLFGFSYFRLS